MPIDIWSKMDHSAARQAQRLALRIKRMAARHDAPRAGQMFDASDYEISVRTEQRIATLSARLRRMVA